MSDDPEQDRHTDPVVLHRLSSLEQRVDRGFSDIDHKLDNLSFVRADVYAANQVTSDQVHGELARDIEAIGTQVKLLWSVVGASVIAALIGFLLEVAQR